MKTPTFLIAILLLANVFALTAQESKTISTDKTVVQKLDLVTIERKAVEMTDNLPGVTLTSEQQEVLTPYAKTFLTQRQEVSFTAVSEKSRKEIIAEKQAINKTYMDAVNSTLTGEQREEQQKYLKQRREESRVRMAVGRPY